MLFEDVQIAHTGLDKLRSDQLPAIVPGLAVCCKDTTHVSSLVCPKNKVVRTSLPEILPNLCGRVLLFHSPTIMVSRRSIFLGKSKDKRRIAMPEWL